MNIHPQIEAVTAAIVKRSAVTRRTYLDFIARERENGLERPILSCGNLAHAFAASGDPLRFQIGLAGSGLGQL